MADSSYDTEAAVRSRYESLVKGWEAEQRIGPSYWLSSASRFAQRTKSRKTSERYARQAGPRRG